MNIRAVGAIALGLLVITSGCWVVASAEPTPAAASPVSVRIYLCERSTMVRIPNAYRDPGYRMLKKEPVYNSETTTWIEIFLPEHKLATHYAGGAFLFFEATETRYRLTPETPMGTPTSATELTTDFTLTHEAMARIRTALEKHLKSKEKSQPDRNGDKSHLSGHGNGTYPLLFSNVASP